MCSSFSVYMCACLFNHSCVSFLNFSSSYVYKFWNLSIMLLLLLLENIRIIFPVFISHTLCYHGVLAFLGTLKNVIFMWSKLDIIFSFLAEVFYFPHATCGVYTIKTTFLKKWILGLFISLGYLYFIFLKRSYLFILREREREGEKKVEKHLSVASCTLPAGDLACDTGMCPNQESNQNYSNWHQTRNSLVCGTTLKPLNHTSQATIITVLMLLSVLWLLPQGCSLLITFASMQISGQPWVSLKTLHGGVQHCLVSDVWGEDMLDSNQLLYFC